MLGTNDAPANSNTNNTNSKVEQESNPSTLNKIPATPESQGQTKRKHVDDEQDSNPRPTAKARQAHTKHPVHWALDGNLLLQFGDTRFKVHRSRLTAESDWFELLIDRRAGTVEDGFEDQKDIDLVIEKMEVIDGLDLFYLDFEDGPSDGEFADLLTAMNFGMYVQQRNTKSTHLLTFLEFLCRDYVYEPPKLETIHRLLASSSYFRVWRYYDFCVQFLCQLFPKAIPTVPDVSPHAAYGVILGREHGIKEILPRAFYDLARSQPRAVGVDNGVAVEPDSPTIDIKDMHCLLDVQKRLVMSWDEIVAKSEPTCVTATRYDCGTAHRLTTILASTRKRYPLDPMVGIREILKTKLVSKEGYCEAASEKVHAELKALGAQIWADFKKWIGASS